MALGKVKFDDYNSRTTLDKAQIQVLGTGAEVELNKNTIVPIYTLTEDLSPKTLTNAIHNALLKFQDKIYEPLPDYIIQKKNFIEKKLAIMDMHNPKTQEEIDNARKRLVFEELFSMQLNLALLRKETQKNESIKLEIKKHGLVEKYINNLPFEITNAQKNLKRLEFNRTNAKTFARRCWFR